jgi:ABC-type phosphate transport system ATPase subunit
MRKSLTFILQCIIWHAEDVRVCVERGSVFALLGPSGCGKTTLLKVYQRNKNKKWFFYNLVPREGGVTGGGQWNRTRDCRTAHINNNPARYQLSHAASLD